MLIRSYWPDCDWRDNQHQEIDLDCYWVEATEDEAQAAIFPLLDAQRREQSENFAHQSLSISNHIAADVPRPYCYLVASDLSSIDPFPAHYPFGNLWNGYSPFREVAARRPETLSDLVGIRIEDGEWITVAT